MKKFFKVTDLPDVLKLSGRFPTTGVSTIPVHECPGRILAGDVSCDADLPDFSRSTMDGHAVCAASTFGASQGAPAFLSLGGSVSMGEAPDFSIRPGEAAKIPTGGMLPEGADSVSMVEHSEAVGEGAVEVFKAVAPGDHVILKGEDFKKGETVLSKGARLRPVDAGLLAAFGKETVRVYEKPAVAIVSTGDEIVPPGNAPTLGQIRDINTHTLAGMVLESGGVPRIMGIVPDSFSDIQKICLKALEESDMALISGGSSVGARDHTLDAIASIPGSEILVHGVSISPGKPTILAAAGEKPFWGLPGHVTSAMVVFDRLVRPFLERMAGLSPRFKKETRIFATLSRNISSAQGRTDYVRVRLREEGGEMFADPVLGKSGLIRTMIKADGLIEIGINTEGLEKGARVAATPL
ncbi:Molybdopterin molybdenumtransferase MoeA [Candidatus Desulfarcum epimagneticum]|uniref:Molybdopterin molybdenumtransferase n=1 Tax=uncultured Desulfobacteraceae bacterium TaxID=218296 RepID=A0A484HJC3_9BACT|nr:Molybdopterin molybdenumtransferase MoeA [uncultured Desulfobacteraceae bacterium]